MIEKMNLGDSVIRFRRYLVALSFVAVAFAMAGLPKVSISSDQNIFFPENNAERQTFERFEALFGSEETLTFVLGRDDRDLWSDQGIAAIRWITERTRTLPNVSRVESLVNFQFSRATEDGIDVSEFIVADLPLTKNIVDRLRGVAANDPRISGLLISEDGRAAGIFVTFNATAVTPVETTDAYERARDLARDFRKEFPELDISLIGSIAIDKSFQAASVADGQTLNVLMVLVIGIMVCVFWRSLKLVGIILMLVTVLSAMTIGVAGWLRYPITPVSAVSPIIVMSMFVANAVHIVHAFIGARTSGNTSRDAADIAISETSAAMAFTAFTTIVGFASLNFAESPPFRHFGNLVTVGVAVGWLLSVSVFPLLLRFASPQKTAVYGGAKLIARGFARLAQGPELARWPTLAVALVVFGGLIATGLSRASLDDNFIRFFGPSFEIRKASDYAAERLVGSYYVEYLLDAKTEGGAVDPKFLRDVDNFCKWLRKRADVAHVVCLTDTIKTINSNLHADDPALYVTPDDYDLASQLLLITEMSLPAGQDIGNQISVDRSAIRVTALTPDISTAGLRRLKSDGEQYFDSLQSRNGAAFGTGLGIMFAYISIKNIEGMLINTLTVIFLIGLTFMVMMRDVRVALIMLIPNLFPIIGGFALWAFFIGDIGMTASVVGAMCVGIIVDDTIHFVARFKQQLRRGAKVDEALGYSFETAGAAMIITSIILIAGFSMLGLSAFAVTWTIGLLSATMIALALAFDLLLLPALLKLTHGKA